MTDGTAVGAIQQLARFQDTVLGEAPTTPCPPWSMAQHPRLHVKYILGFSRCRSTDLDRECMAGARPSAGYAARGGGELRGGERRLAGAIATNKKNHEE